MKNLINEQRINIKDVLLDDDNISPIILYSDKGERIEFNQIAVCPYNDELYCILSPITKLPNIKDNEAVVFKVIEEGEYPYLSTVNETSIAEKIFDFYYFMLTRETHDSLLDFILNTIKNDKNYRPIYTKRGKFDYVNFDIHPFIYRSKTYAIIEDPKGSQAEECLVFEILEKDEGHPRLLWVENEMQASEILESFIEFKEYYNE